MTNSRCEHDMQPGHCGDYASPAPLRWAGHLCGSPADDGTTCYLPLDHEQGACESSTGKWWPWLKTPDGEHSPGDEYLIYPEDRPAYGDGYA